MKNLLKKFRENKKGFTLAELLVVVAIVGILVAISIPVFTAQLGKARQATNNANLRAAKAAAVSEYLTGDTTEAKGGKYEYNITEGTISKYTDAFPGDPIEINTDDVSKKDTYKNIYVEITSETDDTKDEYGDVSVNLYAK